MSLDEQATSSRHIQKMNVVEVDIAQGDVTFQRNKQQQSVLYDKIHKQYESHSQSQPSRTNSKEAKQQWKLSVGCPDNAQCGACDTDVDASPLFSPVSQDSRACEVETQGQGQQYCVSDAEQIHQGRQFVKLKLQPHSSGLPSMNALYSAPLTSVLQSESLLHDTDYLGDSQSSISYHNNDHEDNQGQQGCLQGAALSSSTQSSNDFKAEQDQEIAYCGQTTLSVSASPSEETNTPQSEIAIPEQNYLCDTNVPNLQDNIPSSILGSQQQQQLLQRLQEFKQGVLAQDNRSMLLGMQRAAGQAESSSSQVLSLSYPTLAQPQPFSAGSSGPLQTVPENSAVNHALRQQRSVGTGRGDLQALQSVLISQLMQNKASDSAAPDLATDHSDQGLQGSLADVYTRIKARDSQVPQQIISVQDLIDSDFERNTNSSLANQVYDSSVAEPEPELVGTLSRQRSSIVELSNPSSTTVSTPPTTQLLTTPTMSTPSPGTTQHGTPFPAMSQLLKCHSAGSYQTESLVEHATLSKSSSFSLGPKPNPNKLCIIIPLRTVPALQVATALLIQLGLAPSLHLFPDVSLRCHVEQQRGPFTVVELTPSDQQPDIQRMAQQLNGRDLSGGMEVDLTKSVAYVQLPDEFRKALAGQERFQLEKSVTVQAHVSTPRDSTTSSCLSSDSVTSNAPQTRQARYNLTRGSTAPQADIAAGTQNSFSGGLQFLLSPSMSGSSGVDDTYKGSFSAPLHGSNGNTIPGRSLGTLQRPPWTQSSIQSGSNVSDASSYPSSTGIVGSQYLDLPVGMQAADALNAYSTAQMHVPSVGMAPSDPGGLQGVSRIGQIPYHQSFMQDNQAQQLGSMLPRQSLPISPMQKQFDAAALQQQLVQQHFLQQQASVALAQQQLQALRAGQFAPSALDQVMAQQASMADRGYGGMSQQFQGFSATGNCNSLSRLLRDPQWHAGQVIVEEKERSTEFRASKKARDCNKMAEIDLRSLRVCGFPPIKHYDKAGPMNQKRQAHARSIVRDILVNTLLALPATRAHVGSIQDIRVRENKPYAVRQNDHLAAQQAEPAPAATNEPVHIKPTKYPDFQYAIIQFDSEIAAREVFDNLNGIVIRAGSCALNQSDYHYIRQAYSVHNKPCMIPLDRFSCEERYQVPTDIRLCVFYANRKVKPLLSSDGSHNDGMDIRANQGFLYGRGR